MTKIKKYIIKNIKEFTNLHSSDIDENNANISDLQYKYNCNEVKTSIIEVSHQIFKGTNYKLLCSMELCGNGRISVRIYDNNKYKEVMQFYLKF